MNDPENPFQSVVTLGSLRAVHGYNSFYRNNRFILSCVTFAGMLCCLSLTVFAFIDDTQHPSATPSDISPMFTIGVVGFMMLLGTVIIFASIWEWWRIRNVAVGVFDRGIAYRNAEEEIQLIPWSSIQDVEEHRVRRNRILFTDYYVKTRDGNAYLLHRTLRDVQQLAASIRQNAGLVSPP